MMFETLKITSALQVNTPLWQSAIFYLLFSFLPFFFKEHCKMWCHFSMVMPKVFSILFLSHVLNWCCNPTLKCSGNHTLQ